MAKLVLDGIEKSYGDLDVLKGVNLQLKENEVYGLLGPNGAGKTTLFRTMMGLLKPDSGRVLLEGEEFDFSRQMRSRLGYLPAEVSFYGNLSARENLEFFEGIVETEPDIGRILQLVGLEQDADRKVKGFSTGMKKRLGIAQSLLRDPDVMVYDEPTTGLDPEGKKSFRRHVERINEEKDVTVLVSSHITREIEPMCDRFGILTDGVIAASGTREELSEAAETVRVKVNDSSGIEESFDPVEVDGNEVELKVEEGDVNSVISEVIDSGFRIREVEPSGENLEDVFMRITRD
jgi:ABC-type multidrug transport system ATPase subunit